MEDRVLHGKSSEFKGENLPSRLRNLSVDLFSLIFDARVPCENNGKGYREGPHFPMVPDNHECDLSILECVLYQFHLERILRDKKNPSFVFDVIMLPECCKGDVNNLQIEACLSKPYLLLERWFISFVKTNSLKERPLKKIENLYQVIYSHVHYSQLSSWLSLNNGAIPKAVFYWVKLPGDTGLKSFLTLPQFHCFPAYMVTDEVAISVSVHSFPRIEVVPRLLCGQHFMSQTIFRSLNHQPSLCKQSTCKTNECSGNKALTTASNESSYGQNSLKVQNDEKKKKKRKIKKGPVSSSTVGTIKKEKHHETEKFHVFSCSSIHPPENVTASDIKHIPCQKSVNETNNQNLKVKKNSKHSKKDDGCDGKKNNRSFRSRISSAKCTEINASSEMAANGTQHCESKPIEMPGQAFTLNSPSEMNGKLEEDNKIKVLNCSSIAHIDKNLATTKKIKRKSPSKSAYERRCKKLCSGISSANCVGPNVSFEMSANGVELSESKSKEIIGQQVTGDSYHCNILETHDISHQGISGLNSEEKKTPITPSAHDITKTFVPSKVSFMFDELDGASNILNCSSATYTRSAKNFPAAAKIKQKSPPKSVNKTNNQPLKVAYEKRPCKEYYWEISSSKSPEKTSQVSVSGNHSGKIQTKQIVGQESAKHVYHFSVGEEGDKSYAGIVANEKQGARTAKGMQYCTRSHSAFLNAANKLQIFNNIPIHNVSFEAVNGTEVQKDLKMGETSGFSNCVNKKLYNDKSRRSNHSRFKISENTVNAIGECGESSSSGCFNGRASRSSTRTQFSRNSRSIETKSSLSRLVMEPKKQNAEWLPIRNSSPYPNKNHVKESKPLRSKELLINFEESLLHGCFRKVRSASGYEMYGHIPHSLSPVKFCLPVDVTFYEVEDVPRRLSPLLGVASITDKLAVPKKGCLEVAVFRPCDRVLRDFTVRYNLKNIPPKCHAFIRQRTWVIPGDPQPKSYRKLRYIINIWFESDAAGKFSLCKDIKIAIVDVPVIPLEINEHWEIETEMELVCH